jgi:hypothetical protein
MGDYLMLQWLSTRRGFAVPVLLVLATAYSNLCSYGKRDQTAKPNKPAVTSAQHR